MSSAIDPAVAVRALPAGNIKVTRQDWLDAAIGKLVEDGVDQVKILTLSEQLGVSRSSFYWYFESRRDLLDALLGYWEQKNTAGLVGQARLPAATVTEAVCNVSRCFLDSELFDSRLDFAVKDWARRSRDVRELLERSDESRVDAIREMFQRFEFDATEALIRARVLYYMQIGYYAAELDESVETRLALFPTYVRVFTGREPLPPEIAEFTRYALMSAERECP